MSIESRIARIERWIALQDPKGDVERLHQKVAIERQIRREIAPANPWASTFPRDEYFVPREPPPKEAP